MSESNGKPLSEITGRASRAPRMSLEDARAMILSGVPFGDVLPQLDSHDEPQLREWFCHDEQVTMNRRATYHANRLPQQAYPSGDFCKCGGLLVQDGKCKKCSGCGFSEGSCS